MVRYLFFDLYGTLVNITTDEGSPDTAAAFGRWVESRWGPAAAQRERERPFGTALRALGPPLLPHEEPDIAPLVRTHLESLLGRSPTSDEIARAAEAFRAASRRELTLVPGALEALAALRPRFGIGLISNAQLLFTRPELRQMKLEGLFDPLVISSEVGVRKPSPQIFELALRQARIAAHQALHVGNDPVDDIQAAAAAGLRTALVRDQRRTPFDPGAQPDLRVDSVAQLPPVLLGARAPDWV